MNRTRWMIAALILLTLVVYWPVYRYGFIGYDDPAYLADNPYIQTGINRASLHDAFFNFRFANYAPVVSISYCLDQTLFRLRPSAMHIENVVYHMISGLLLWRLLIQATGEKFKSYAVAVLFVCHPMHVESVCWIAERKDVLSTTFLLAAMCAYVSFCRRLDNRNRRGWIISYAQLIVLYLLSLLSKSMGATLPGVLILMDIWPLRRWPGRGWVALIKEKVPLIVLAATAVLISNHALKIQGGLNMLPWLTITDRIENALVCYAIYLGKMLVPINLAIYYPHPGGRPLAAVFAAVVLLLILSLVVWRGRMRKPYLLIGWLWFIGGLLPVIQLVQIGPHAMADRYSYFPSIGLTIALVWGVYDIARRLAPLVFISVVITYSIMAHHQVGYWQNTYVMFTHVLEVTPDSSLPHYELGGVAMENHDVRRAIEEYQHAIDVAPDFAPYDMAYDGLGSCYIGIDYSKAVFYFQQAVNLRRDSYRYETHLANALNLRGDWAPARKHLDLALKVNPEYSPACTLDREMRAKHH